MTSMVVTIDDIFDQLWSENKRLLKELLFANKCLNILDELKTELNLIYKKFETQLNTEDKFNQLRHQLNYIFNQRHDKTFVENNNQLLRYDTNYAKHYNQLIDRQEDINNRIKCIDKKYSEDTHFDDNESKDIDVIKTDTQNHESINSSDFVVNNIINEQKLCDSHKQSDGLNEEVLSKNEYYDSTTDTYICPQNDCQKSFKYLKSLTFHQKKAHKAVKRKVIDESDIKQQYYDSITNSFICPQNDCHKCIKDLKKFLLHKKTCKPNKSIYKRNYYDINGKYLCRYDNCFKTYAARSGRRMHERYYHERQTLMKCQQKDCQFECIHDNQMKIHLNRKHSVVKPFVCPISGCNKALKSKESFQKHSLIHKNFVIKCQFDGCQRQFRNESHLKRHMSQHKSEPTLKCSVKGCLEMFFSDNQMVRHGVLVHNKIKKKKPAINKQCDWPGCDYFGKSISSHKLVHTGVKQFACLWPQCSKRFTSNHKLTDHMNIHNNVKPYACRWPGCDYRCASHSNINKHMKQVHQK
ncbi:zinc finger protein 79-like [Oppia nitens]|uniref:zinc finger protein 79-like n=1 Tax=Oppia nitens TaxID=1686743 RepID=UPI0023DA97BB|nr:zinc finger protein 79-like [Oppia nitens]